MKFLVKPFGQHGFSMEGKFRYYLPLYEAFVMKWSALLGTMSLQEQQICGSEIMSERIKFLDFFFNFRLFFFPNCAISRKCNLHGRDFF